MKVKKLLERVDYVVIQGRRGWKETEITSVAYDSGKVQKGSLFVCIQGENADGHEYIEEACQLGAAALIVEKMVSFPENVMVFLVRDSREALALVSACWFGYPAEKLNVIGVTGTKGKTTTAYMIYYLLKAAGYKAGLIGTIETIIGEERISSKNTTPESFTIQEYFDKIEKIGCEFAVMEVSSQGVKQKRILGIPFKAAVFTNFEKDHIGPREHASIEEYRRCKAQVFQQCEIGIGNLDDAQCSYMFKCAQCRKYGFTCDADMCRGKRETVLCAERIRCEMGKSGPETRFMAAEKEYRLQMPGIFNVYNALAALQSLHSLGITVPDAPSVLAEIQIKGRMQRIVVGENIACYIDYAHNAMSLKNVLSVLRTYQSGRILLVFGCGGGRAKDRRAEMGEVAGALADVSILTSDNPRYESPRQIIEDIIEGIERTKGRYIVIEERQAAIAFALGEAKPGDMVLIAGKGHENYQEIRGVRCHMDDCELVEQFMKEQKEKQNVRRYNY